MSDTKEYLISKPVASVVVDGKVLPEKEAKRVKDALKKQVKPLKENETSKEQSYLKG